MVFNKRKAFKILFKRVYIRVEFIQNSKSEMEAYGGNYLKNKYFDDVQAMSLTLDHVCTN